MPPPPQAGHTQVIAPVFFALPEEGEKFPKKWEKSGLFSGNCQKSGFLGGKNDKLVAENANLGGAKNRCFSGTQKMG